MEPNLMEGFVVVSAKFSLNISRSSIIASLVNGI